MGTEPTKVTMYTDGACSGNPGPGGWAALLRWNEHEKLVSGGDPSTTNNRMELLAVIQGLRSLKRGCSVRIVTDSRYVMDGMTKWISGWRRRGWKTASKAPVKNQDLWESLDREVSLHKVEWEWVAGHSGHAENDLVDEAARAAIPF